MTTPGILKSTTGGSPSSFAGNATITSADFVLDGNSREVAVYVLATQAGTVQIFRVDASGTERALNTAQALAANTEEAFSFEVPLNAIRAKYVNNNNTAGTVRFEVYIAQ